MASTCGFMSFGHPACIRAKSGTLRLWPLRTDNKSSLVLALPICVDDDEAIRSDVQLSST